MATPLTPQHMQHPHQRFGGRVREHFMSHVWRLEPENTRAPLRPGNPDDFQRPTICVLCGLSYSTWQDSFEECR